MDVEEKSFSFSFYHIHGSIKLMSHKLYCNKKPWSYRLADLGLPVIHSVQPMKSLCV